MFVLVFRVPNLFGNEQWMTGVKRVKFHVYMFRSKYICGFYLKISQRIFERSLNPYPTAFPYGNGMVLHFYQQQESSTTKTVHKVINKGLKAYV